MVEKKNAQKLETIWLKLNEIHMDLSDLANACETGSDDWWAIGTAMGAVHNSCEIIDLIARITA